MSGKKQKSSGKKKSGMGLALWVLALLVLLVVFLVNQHTIFGNIKKSGFFDKAGVKTPEMVEKAAAKAPSDNYKNDVAPVETIEIDLNGTGSHIEEEKKLDSIVAQNEAAREQKESASEVKENEVKEEKPLSQEKKEVTVKKEISVKTESVETMKLRLYFMTINSSGSVLRKEITREMKKSSSPLMDAINALIEGPSPQEEGAGCRSLISNGTKLIGASVKDNVATLNFSGEFEFNQYGIEGLRGQLQQIVFTATAFPTVESVQFLVDGEKREYLGSEGVWIGTPLDRTSF